MGKGNGGYSAGPPGQIARGHLRLCTQGMEPGSCQEVQGRGRRSGARPSSWGGYWGDLVLGGGLGRTDVDFLDQAPGRHWTVDSDPGFSHPALGSPSPVTAAATMLLPRTALLLTLLLAAGSLGQRARRPPRPLSPISAIQPKANFDAQQVELGGGRGGRSLPSLIGVRPGSPIPSCPCVACPQFAGTWLLVAVASSCRFLQEQGHRAEATTMQVAPQGTAMAIDTFRKLDGICWQVRQLYGGTQVPGRFLLQARGARGAVDVVVGDTDYQSFAILYLERARQLSVKLYARSLPVGDAALNTFEQRVQGANLTEDHIWFFPKYGFCDTADQFHILDEARR
ncbi:complement component C8 gamma chain isoform X2 [Pteropus alecto]|uniref:complement component C8 gamma chain isoform X2 n=1 Tax=Pteropus alecto TaxID=9402 RepID=UPI000D53662D|nr:complement component C8 gamma chain isoform X2 [Pteropus alecto]